MAGPSDPDHALVSSGVSELRLIHLSNAWTVVVDVIAWGLVHALTGYFVHRLPARRFRRDAWLFQSRRIERSGRLYTHVLRIRRWKDRLPEAGALFAGGVSKRHLPATDRAGLEQFAIETRRAELGHWLAAAAGPLFVLWNPPAVAIVMVAYGVVVNAPFIAIQRYNRLRVARVSARSTRPGARVKD